MYDFLLLYFVASYVTLLQNISSLFTPTIPPGRFPVVAVTQGLKHFTIFSNI